MKRGRKKKPPQKIGILLKPFNTTILPISNPYLETEALLAGAEGTEVLGRLRDDVGAEFELDATSGGATDRDVEVDLR